MAKMYAPVPGTSNFKGLRNGYSQVQLGLPENAAGANSNVANNYLPDFQFSTPFLVMYAAESWFLRAEGALNGWNMGSGTAQSFYEQGIRTSMASWGFTGAAVDAYIAGTTTPIALNDGVQTPALSNIPVKWEATTAKQREQVLTQNGLPTGQTDMKLGQNTAVPVSPNSIPVSIQRILMCQQMV